MIRPTALIACLFIAPGSLNAQEAARPFSIMDNSFLVEEAFNQEKGVFQNILVIQRAEPGEWSFEFTQEWPLGGMTHQLSYTIPMEAAGALRRGTLALNYRYQLFEESAQRPALSPRLSLLVPSQGDDSQVGLQFNLPASKQYGDVYVHANAGYTLAGVGSLAGTTSSALLGASLNYRLLDAFHLMLESAYRTNEFDDGSNSMLLAPGARAALNFGRKQLVLGVATPFGLLRGDDPRSLLVYLSYELPLSD